MQIGIGLLGPKSVRWRHQKLQRRAAMESRNLQYLICMCVGLSPFLLALQAPNRLVNDTNSSSAISAQNLCGDFAKNAPFRIEKTALSRTTLRIMCACVSFIWCCAFRRAIATNLSLVQRIVEDCFGRTNSGFSRAPNQAYTDTASPRSQRLTRDQSPFF